MKSGLKKGLTGDDLDSYVDIFMYGFRSAALVEFLSGEVSLETVIARSDMPEAEFRRFAREHGTDSIITQTFLCGINEQQQGVLCRNLRAFLDGRFPIPHLDSSANGNKPPCI